MITGSHNDELIPFHKEAEPGTGSTKCRPNQTA
jgi:hypothetical protein